jgi:uncharacterized protein YkwD
MSSLRISTVAVALAIAALAGCSGAPRKVGAQPSWRHGGATDDGEPTPHPSGPITFAPSAPATARYNDPPIRPAPSSTLADAIVAAVVQAAAEVKVTPPVADGRLYAAAGELAEVVPDEGVVAYPLVEFALQRHGIIEPSPHLLVIWGPLDQPDAIVEQLAPRLPELLAAGPTRIGVGTAGRTAAGEGVVVLALQASYVVTKPIPRALPDGGSIRVEGRVTGSFRDPEVFVTHDDGSVTRPATAGTAVDFAATVECGRRRGRQQIEITAFDTTGSTVLANFPVWCNESPPTELTVEASSDDNAVVTTPEAAEQRMLELVNRDRTGAGLPALVLDPRVVEVARAHSREMRATGVVAHVSPTTGSAADRVRAASIKTAAVLENVARAYGVAEAEDGLMNSPGHRANLLSPLATHVGIGIVFGEQVSGRRELFVTQVFIRIPPPLDRARTLTAIRDMVHKKASPEDDPVLDQVAQVYADTLAGGGDQAAASKRAAKALEAHANRFRRVGSVVTAIADVSTLNADTLLGNEVPTHLGIGIAQGPHPELGEGAIWVVLLIGQAR